MQTSNKYYIPHNNKKQQVTQQTPNLHMKNKYSNSKIIIYMVLQGMNHLIKFNQNLRFMSLNILIVPVVKYKLLNLALRKVEIKIQ